MPLRSYTVFCLAVACTFTAVAVVNDLFELEHSNGFRLIVKILTTGGLSLLCVLYFHQRVPRKLTVSIAVAYLAMLIVLGRLLGPVHTVPLTLEGWRIGVAFHGFLILVFVLFSYGWFGTFFRMEGKRYYSVHTEMQLASRIQEQLVPEVQLAVGEIEVYGASLPSGTVGGDLVDAVEVRGGVCAYLADVAGHGVAAGVLMSMVKTAVRMHLRTNPQNNEGLLEAVNDTLAPLTDASAYLTFAYLSFEPGKPLTYSLAAHLPILHLQRRSGLFQQHSIENLPIGMFPDIAYSTATVDLEQGDILAVVTNGLTEVFNTKDRELGDDYISQILRVSAPRPLKEIAANILHFARNHGKATDDQTLLLLRRR
jgi:hypothetical protein